VVNPLYLKDQETGVIGCVSWFTILLFYVPESLPAQLVRMGKFLNATYGFGLYLKYRSCIF
jgi:hypothetical protein